MASPKSGTAGSLVTPAAPTDSATLGAGVDGSNTTTSNSGSKSGSAPTVVTVKPMAHKPGSDDNKDKTSWIELQLVYESNGLPVAGMAYEVTLPDGTTVAAGTTDDQGVGRVDHIDPGSCQISFPSLDKEAWEDA